MKKLIFLLTITLLFVNLPASAFAAPAASPSGQVKGVNDVSDKLNNQINELKEKIASRVAELNLVEKRGIIGTVSEVSGNKITLTDIHNNTRFVDVDEITKFSSPSAKGSFGLSDLTKGTKVSVLGLYNKQSQRVLARFIDVSIDPQFLGGTVSDLDKKNITFMLNSENNKQTKIDIETVTKILSYSNADGLARSGFSKLAAGDRAYVIGFPDKKDPTMIVGTRVVDFSDLPKNPKIVIPDSSDSAGTTITPSSGNGKTITPLKK